MGFIPVRRGARLRPVEEAPAQLLYTKRCLIHGQFVDVSVWGPGPSGRASYKSGPDMVTADRVAREWERKSYHPSQELAYIGLPSSIHRDMMRDGEKTKWRKS